MLDNQRLARRQPVHRQREQAHVGVRTWSCSSTACRWRSSRAKNAADENATIWTAFQQLQTYKAEVPSLFAFNDLLAVSDGVEARVGTFTAGREWFKPWRTVSGEHLADPHLMFGRHAPPLRLNIKKWERLLSVYGLGALLAPLNQLNSKPKLSILRWQCRARRWSRASALMCTVNLKGASLRAHPATSPEELVSEPPPELHHVLERCGQEFGARGRGGALAPARVSSSAHWGLSCSISAAI